MHTKNVILIALCTITPFIVHAREKKQLTSGILIAIEGIDGAGKSTIAQAVSVTLQEKGFDILLTREPGDSALGKKIRELVQTQTMPISSRAEFLLFAADRAQHFAELVIPALQQNRLVISDRIADSSLAYQGYGRSLDTQTLRIINSWAMESTVPHLTIFVRVPVVIALERCKKRPSLSVFEHEQFLDKVAAGFEEIYHDRNDVIVVDGTESPVYLTTQICDAIEQWIQNNNLLK